MATKVRGEEAGPKRLQDAAAAARKVVQALQGAKDAVEAQLEEWRGRLRQVEEAQRQLQAEEDEGRDVEAVQPEGLDLLQDAASLLEARCGLQVQLEDATDWKSDVQQAAPHRIELNPFLLRLLQDGSIAKVGPPQRRIAPQVVVFGPGETLDVKNCLPTEDCEDLREVLQDADLDKVRCLVALQCRQQPAWCKALLQRVAPRVQKLEVYDARREHLDVIRDMLALRYLRIYWNEAPCPTDAPDLPLQLEDLVLWDGTEQHLQSVQRMPNLRKLIFWRDDDSPIDVAFPLLPPDYLGLQWLSVRLQPLSTVVSLAKAHATTVQELSVVCASEGDSPWHFTGLADGLEQCGLAALRRVVLERGWGGHGKDSCRKQKHAVEDKLQAVGSERAARAVEVLCSMCDKCPLFPDLGDFN